jgi:hypothetical protein
LTHVDERGALEIESGNLPAHRLPRHRRRDDVNVGRNDAVYMPPMRWLNTGLSSGRGSELAGLQPAAERGVRPVWHSAVFEVILPDADKIVAGRL